MNEDEREFWHETLISLQRALWGMITPELRAVAVGAGVNSIQVRFIYDRPITDDDLEVVSEVEGYVSGDFSRDVRIEFSTTVSRDRIDWNSGESWWAFIRRDGLAPPELS